MKFDTIAEIAIDAEGRLLVKPTANSYPFVYREAVEVHWDSSGKYLYSPKPREWSYLDWFKHIIHTVDDLILTRKTLWRNIPEDLRKQMEAWMKSRQG